MKSKTIKHLSIFHRLTVLLAFSYLGWAFCNIEVQVPEIAYLIQIIIPALFEDLMGGSFTDLPIL